MMTHEQGCLMIPRVNLKKKKNCSKKFMQLEDFVSINLADSVSDRLSPIFVKGQQHQ